MMMNSRPHDNARRGNLGLELLLALPICVLIILAMIEFSWLLMVRQQLTAASREGARVAATGGNAVEVEDAVKTFLGNGSLSAAQVQSVLTDMSGNPLPSGASVQVLVSIPAIQVVPDMLAPFGFSISSHVIQALTTMRKE